MIYSDLSVRAIKPQIKLERNKWISRNHRVLRILLRDDSRLSDTRIFFES